MPKIILRMMAIKIEASLQNWIFSISINRTDVIYEDTNSKSNTYYFDFYDIVNPL